LIFMFLIFSLLSLYEGLISLMLMTVSSDENREYFE
jgi:hypothetical protein